MSKKEKDYGFNVTGSFSIDSDLPVVESFDKRVVGFKLSDGRTVRLVVALEVESEDGSKFGYITSEKAMGNLGFRCLDYERLEFEERA